MQTAARDRDERDFGHYLRTGRDRPRRIELKFNPNHDPVNGQFTSGDGGGRAAEHKRPDRGEGPFREAALRHDALGQTARAVNTFVHGRSSSMTLPLGGMAGDVTVTRGKDDAVTLNHRFFSASGQLSVIPGREEIRLQVTVPRMKAPTARIVSYPSEVRIFQAVSGNINFSLNKDLITKSIFGTSRIMDRGTYIFSKHAR